MTTTWSCPKCKRGFTRKNQRHACGTGDRAVVLRNRPAELVALYEAVETFAQSLGAVEVVTRERYVLFRSKRIFADLAVMSDALRIAIHLPRKVASNAFIKVVPDRRQVTHVVKVQNLEGLEVMKPFLREAYEHSIS